MKNKLFVILLLVVCSIPAIYPLLHSGFFSSDDGEWMIIRFSAFYQALRDGQFPVRFLTRLNFGYGYPVANFLYPGFMYLGVPIHVLGFGFVDTIKIILASSMVGSLIFSYLWLTKLFNKWASFVGSVVFLYTPYHLYDLYKRGSVGEVLSVAVLPFILWQIERKSFFWTTLGIGFLLLAHNTLAVLFLGIIVLYMGLNIYLSKNRKNLIPTYFLMLLIGFGISAFFWISALHDLKYTVFYEKQISNWNEYFAQHSLVGLSTYGILLISIIFFSMRKIKIARHRLSAILLIVGLLSVFLSLEQSSVLWKNVPVAFIQFPFRFLSLTILAVAFLAAVIVAALPRKQSFLLGGFLIVLTSISVVPYLRPQEFFDKGEGFYTTNMGTTTVKNEYMPKWVKSLSQEYSRQHNATKIIIYPSRDDSVIRVNTVYFPGWKAYTNGQEIPIDYNNENGLMDIVINQGTKEVRLVFTETTPRLFSDGLSLVSMIGLIAISIKSRWRIRI